MSSAPRATLGADSEELLALVRDLGTHLEWLGEQCPSDLLPADEQWMTARREQYRTYVPEIVATSEPSEHVHSLPLDTSTRTSALGAPLDHLQRETATPPEAMFKPKAPPAVAAAVRIPPAGTLPAATPAEFTPPTPALSAAPAQRVATTPLAAPSIMRPSPPPGADSAVRLQLLAERVSQCKQCDLCATRTQTVFSRGSTQSGIVFVGEGPGADEDAQGQPFVGKAGQLLDRMVEAMGLTRDEVYICNIVKCRPPDNRKPEEREIAACSAYLTEQLELTAPKVIVALGATAVQGLLGLSIGITRIRGQWRLYRGQVPVMPTFHPAYLLRQPTAKREVWQDLQAVLEHLGRKPPPRAGA